MVRLASSSVSKSSLAPVVLAAIWVVFGVLLWVIFVSEPVIVPLWVYGPGILLTVLFGGGLLASKRWDSVWRHTFDPTMPIPSWVWIGGVATAVGVVFVSIWYSISFEGAVWMAVFAGATSYAVVVAARRDWLRRFVPFPSWIVVSFATGLAVVIAISIAIEAGTLLTTVFLIALLLFTFHVCFILPLTYYQARQGFDRWQPSTYPTVTALIPAYNEEGIVGDCIESVLRSTYPTDELEVVVVDDGSTDGTYEEAAAYRDRGVKVFQRENGGKHAALNFGLQCTDSSVVVSVDADSRPEPTAIEKMVGQLQADPSIGALSAAVLATNDNAFLTRLQRVEYAISNTNRRAYSVFEAVPVVPGCLGVYRREALDDVWGYDPDTVTEDFDLTIKLLKNGWKVQHGTGVVWTIVPEGWRGLWHQRLRWYQGGLETLRKHWRVLLAPQYGYLHALSLPARLVSHLFGPVGSYVILGAVVWGFLTNPTTYLVTLIVLFFALTVLITLFSLLLEDEPLRTLVYAPLLFVGYKHFIDCTIGVGTIRAFVREQRW